MVDRYRKVVVTSGHMIDLPDRAAPRFPSAKEPVVAAAVERAFDDWDIGPEDLVLNGGARGADVLFAERAHRRGAAVELLLALAPASFECTSVALPDSIWVERFRHLLAHHVHRVVGDDEGAGAANEFARANLALIGRAAELAPPAELLVALVWDGRPAGGPGGTADFAALARRFGAPLVVIDPTTI